MEYQKHPLLVPILPEKKVSGLFISIQMQHFHQRTLKKTAIFQDFCMNFYENFYREIKTIRLECNGEKILKI